MLLVTEIYNLTKSFPDDEKFGITSQMRRASVSIPTNIAEGAGRETKKEFKRFLYISLGSASELETLTTIAQNLGFVHDLTELKTKMLYVKRMLMKLIKTVEK